MTKDEIMNLIDRSLCADLGFTDEDGKQNIRRFFCVWHKGIGRHLISTNTSSSHVKSLLKKSDACLYFADNDSFEGICLPGNVIVHFEREYKELLWNEGDEKYYADGIDDEDYCVIEFIADSGRYYRFDGKGSLTKDELLQYDTGRKYENGYSRLNPD